MSIKAQVSELEAIKQEIKILNERKKKLREKEKKIETFIAEYLRAKSQPGLKHEGTAIILEEVEKPSSKKVKEKDIDAMNVLQKYGIENSEKVLKEIMQARKGEPIVKSTLKFKKYKT